MKLKRTIYSLLDRIEDSIILIQSQTKHLLNMVQRMKSELFGLDL